MVSAAVPCIGIPYCNRYDLLLRCVRSIDVPVQQLVIVDQCIEPLNNARRQELRAACAAFAPTVRFSRHRNSGCAGAWNEIILSTPAPYWLLVNNDIEFAPGDLSTMRDYVATHPKHAAVYGNHGASWWTITADAVGAVGLFDENFWPAYLEDCDWSVRCDLLGLKRSSVPNTHARHGDESRAGSCTANENAEIRAAISWCHGQNFSYYERKWGGRNERETFTHPFNDPQWPVWAWRFEPAWRAHLMARARACT